MGDYWKTLNDVAKATGYSVDHVKRLRTEGLPGRSGRYPKTRVWRWLLDRARSGQDDEKTNWRKIREQADARAAQKKDLLLALQLAEREARLVTRRQAEQDLTRAITRMLAALQRVPAELAPRLAGRNAASVRKELTAWVDDERQRLEKELRK